MTPSTRTPLDAMKKRASWQPSSVGGMPRKTGRRDQKEAQAMIYVGIDLHRKRSQIAALDEQGTELLSRRVANEPEALKAILDELGGELQVALEATYGWKWLAELLESEGHGLHLSHPL